MNPYRHFDGMCWPTPCEDMHDIERNLSIKDPPSKNDLLVAASIISSYCELIALPEKKRNAVIRELRKGPGIK